MKQFCVSVSVVCLLGAATACSNSPTSPTTSSSGSDGVSSITTLQTTDVTVGSGTVATNGRTMTVQYTGWLYSESAADHHGAKFDSSFDRNQAFQFVLGAGSVIRGWDLGVLGMKVGGERILIIPPSLGYGSAGVSGAIPGNATLVFDIQLTAVN